MELELCDLVSQIVVEAQMAKTNLVLFSEVAQIIVCRRQNLDHKIPNTFSDLKMFDAKPGLFII